MGYKAVPNAVFLDEAGVVRYAMRGFDIRKQDCARLVDEFARGGVHTDSHDPSLTGGDSHDPEAMEHYRHGVCLYRRGQFQEALREWRKGVVRQPDNYIIRKQVWAVEHPERFYGDEVDYDWQRQQRALEEL